MARRKPLSTVVADDLLAQIRSGKLAPGAQLPTEAELCAAYEVSRTVIREAVARLRSEGLIIPEQGRGMFVSEAPAPRNFSISGESLKTLPETISLLELRLSVETEAAGLCAERRTEKEAQAIVNLMNEIDARQEDPSSVEIHYDYAFHLAIAQATRNEFIHGFLTYLRPIIVPRFQLGLVVMPELKHAYYDRIHAEHTDIVTAIVEQSPETARANMRRHLSNSLERVRALALASGIDQGNEEQKAVAAKLFAELTRPMPSVSPAAS